MEQAPIALVVLAFLIALVELIKTKGQNWLAYALIAMTIVQAIYFFKSL